MGKMNTEQREIPFKFLVMSRPLHSLDFPGGSEVKNLCANAGNAGDAGWIPGRGEIPWMRKRQPTSVFLPGESHAAWQATGHGGEISWTQFSD